VSERAAESLAVLESPQLAARCLLPVGGSGGGGSGGARAVHVNRLGVNVKSHRVREIAACPFVA